MRLLLFVAASFYSLEVVSKVYVFPALVKKANRESFYHTLA